MKIVNANINDAALIGRVVVDALGEELVNQLAGTKSAEDVTRMFATLAARDDSQYSWRNTLKAIDDDGEPMGYVVGYDGSQLHELRKAFFTESRLILDRDMEGTMGDECGADEFYLDSLAVFPGYRGRGVARALISAMARRAADSGKPLGLLCDKTNTRARALYDSLGFKHVGETPFAWELMDHLQLPLQ